MSAGARVQADASRSTRAHLSIMRNRSFVLLWIGLLLSGAGDWINYVAMVALVYRQTHSALALAGLRLCHIVPILVVGPFAGVFVDRWSRKRTLITTPLAACVAVGILTFVHPVPLVFLAYGVITIALTFFNPARSAVIPNIVEPDQLVSANALAQITATTSILVGGLAGGLIVATAGVTAAFVLDALSFLLIALLIIPVRVHEARLPVRAASLERELAEGVHLLRREPAVANVVVAGAIFVFAPATVLTIGIAFVQTVLHSGSAVYGEILAGLGLGSVLGAVWMIGFHPPVRHDFTFAVSGIVLGLGVAGLGLSRGVLPAAAAYGVVGFASMVNTVSAVTLIQELVPDNVRGRIFAVSSTFDHLGAFASTVAIGLGAAVGAGGLIAGSGGVAALTGLGSLWFVRRSRSCPVTGE